MFSVDPIHPIFSAVIEVVAVTPRVTIAELHAKLKKAGVKVSLANLYRVVTRMVDKQILLKVKGELTINLMWVSYLEFIAGRAKRIMQHSDEFPLAVGEKRTYAVKTLFDVEAVWNHVLVSLYRMLQVKELHKYYSHAWWQLGRNAEEISFYKQLKERGIECRWVIGDDTFLDKVGAERIREVFPAVTLSEQPFPKHGYNLNVYGDYIVECILPDNVEKHFAFLFKKTTNMKEFDPAFFTDLFSLRGNFKVTVWRNAKQAKALRESLTRYFPSGGSAKK